MSYDDDAPRERLDGRTRLVLDRGEHGITYLSWSRFRAGWSEATEELDRIEGLLIDGQAFEGEDFVIYRNENQRVLYSVAVYLCDLANGGPEEGGWTYLWGEPAEEYGQFTRYFRSLDAAHAYSERLDKRLCDKLNVGRRPMSSVLSTGRYSANVNPGAPARFPSHRPHYE